MSIMSLILAYAEPFDVARIAEIHMAAFGANEMLQAQFPTPAVRAALKTSIEMKALDDIKDPKTSVMVVWDVLQSEEILNVEGELRGTVQVQDGRDAYKRKGKIISFAKWSHPIAEGEDYIEPPWVWPEGTATEVLDNWSRKLEEAQERVIGRKPCYRKNCFPSRMNGGPETHRAMLLSAVTIRDMLDGPFLTCFSLSI